MQHPRPENSTRSSGRATRRRSQRLVALVAATLLLGSLAVLGSAASAQGTSRELPADTPAVPGDRFSAALDAKRDALPALMGTPGVVGAGVGETDTGMPAVVVFVEDEGVDDDPIPPEIDGVPTKTVVSGVMEAQAACPPAVPDTYCDRPVPAGVSVGHIDTTAGTLGALVRDADDKSYMLSNNHVLADENNAQIGDLILQPGPIDGGDENNPDHHIGKLSDFEPLLFCANPAACDENDPPNVMDAAVAEVDPADVMSETYCGWEPSSTPVPVEELEVGEPLHKCGITTIATTGSVMALDVSIEVNYSGGTNKAFFEHQIMVEHAGPNDLFSKPGDSGALVVDDDLRPVGLHYASNSDLALNSPIEPILDRFGVTVEGEEYVPPSSTTTLSTTTTTTTTIAPSSTTTSSTTTTTVLPGKPVPTRSGYWMLERDGTIYAFGDAPGFAPVDATATSSGPAEAVSIEARRDGRGVWVLDSAGVVHVRGSASHYGNVDLATLRPGEHVSSISAMPAGDGYLVFTEIGRAIPFGAAQFYGDMSSVPLNGPVLDSVVTPSGLGYYQIAGDGGAFSFGDAIFWGSTGGLTLQAPVVGVVPDPDEAGYWFPASDGGMFAFNAEFHGSMGGIPLNRPVVGAVAFGNSYLQVGSDGGLFNFSDLPFYGSLGASPPDTPVADVAAFAS